MFYVTRILWALVFGYLASGAMHAMDTSEQQLIERGVQSIIRGVARSIKVDDDFIKGGGGKRVQFSAHSERVLAAECAGVKIYDVNARYEMEPEGRYHVMRKTYPCIYELTIPDSNKLYDACWLPGHVQIVSSSHEDRIAIRDLETNTILKSYNTIPDYTSLSVSPGGKLVALAPRGESIALLNLETDEITEIGQRSSCIIPCVRFSPDGQRIAFIEGGTVSVYNLTNGAIEYEHLQNVSSFYTVSLCFDSVGSKLAMGGEYCPIRVYDMVTGELQTELRKKSSLTCRGAGRYIKSLSFFPDGNHLASIDHEGDAGVVHVWNCENGTYKRRDFGEGQVVDVSPDGTRVVVGDKDWIQMYESLADGTRKEQVDVLKQPHIQFLKEQDERLQNFFDGELTPEQKNILLLLLASEDKETKKVVERMLPISDLASGKARETLQEVLEGFSAFHPIIQKGLNDKIKKLRYRIHRMQET